MAQTGILVWLPPANPSSASDSGRRDVLPGGVSDTQSSHTRQQDKPRPAKGAFQHQAAQGQKKRQIQLHAPSPTSRRAQQRSRREPAQEGNWEFRANLSTAHREQGRAGFHLSQREWAVSQWASPASSKSQRSLWLGARRPPAPPFLPGHRPGREAAVSQLADRTPAPAAPLTRVYLSPLHRQPRKHVWANEGLLRAKSWFSGLGAEAFLDRTRSRSADPRVSSGRSALLLRVKEPEEQTALGGERPLSGRQLLAEKLGQEGSEEEVEGTASLPTPRRQGCLEPVEACPCDCTGPGGGAVPPALPAKARDTIHHEPHPPPLLRLCSEVADAQEQRQPHGRGGEHLLP